MSATALGMIILAYLCGSISSAIVVCRIAGLPDPRENGSGNPGATNVLRIGGKAAAAAVLILMCLKACCQSGSPISSMLPRSISG